MPKPAGRLLLALSCALAAVGAACGTSARVAPTVTSGASPTATITTVPPIVSIGLVPTSPPANLPDPDVSWALTAAPGGHVILVGAVRSPKPGGHVALVLVTGTESLNTDYVRFAQNLAGRGFDVAFGCTFVSNAPAKPSDPQIGCPDAPEFVGVADDAVPDVDALVGAARLMLGHPAALGLVGFSRGGGVVMLRAADGARDPVISIAGMLEGTTTWGQLPTEVDVVQRAGGISTPVLLLHGDDDGLIPVTQARNMEEALRARGVDVTAHYYPGAGHGLAQDPAIREDLLTQITMFMCSRSDCTPSAPGG